MTRDLRRLLAAQIPADFADLLDFVAIAALLTYDWHAPPMVFAWFAVAMALPYLLIGPLAGLLVDRVDTRLALIASNLGRGAGSALLGARPELAGSAGADRPAQFRRQRVHPRQTGRPADPCPR